MLVQNTYSKPVEVWCEVFRIEHRETQEGAFRGCAVEMDWHAFSIAMPFDTGEAAISSFLHCVSEWAIFAYPTLPALLSWFKREELEEMEGMGYLIAVFEISDDPRASALSKEQVVFIRSRARRVRDMLLTCDTLSQ